MFVKTLKKDISSSSLRKKNYILTLDIPDWFVIKNASKWRYLVDVMCPNRTLSIRNNLYILKIIFDTNIDLINFINIYQNYFFNNEITDKINVKIVEKLWNY